MYDGVVKIATVKINISQNGKLEHVANFALQVEYYISIAGKLRIGQYCAIFTGLSITIWSQTPENKLHCIIVKCVAKDNKVHHRMLLLQTLSYVINSEYFDIETMTIDYNSTSTTNTEKYSQISSFCTLVTSRQPKLSLKKYFLKYHNFAQWAPASKPCKYLY